MFLRVLFVGAFFCIVAIAQDIPQAVEEIAIAEFHKPYILVVTGPVSWKPKRMLFDAADSDPVTDTFRALNKNWEILGCNELYQPPPKNVGNFKIWKAKQVVAILNEGVALSLDLLEREITRWKTNPSWSARANILVVLLGAGRDQVQEIFLQLWRQTKATNVVVMTAVHKEEIELYGIDPYPQGCVLQVKSLGVFRKGVNLKATLFPKRMSWNLNQCKVVAACVAVAPYVYSNHGDQPFTTGIEVKIFQSLAKMLNFTYGYVESPKDQSPWMIFQDDEPAGLIGRLYRHEADFAFFGMRMTWNRFQLVDIIDSYYGDTFVWVTSLPEKIPPWYGFFAVFDSYMWIGTFVILVTVPAVLALLTGMSIGDATLKTIAFMLNTSQPLLFYQTLIRVFLTFFFISILNITAAYQSGLFQVLTSGLTVTPVESAIEAAHQGYIFRVYPSAKIEMEASQPQLYSYITSNGLVVWTEDHIGSLELISEQRKEVTLLSTMVVLYENKRFLNPSGRSLLRTMKERYGTYEPVFYMARDHPLQPAVQSAMRRLIEYGWVQHYIETLLSRHDVSETAEETENVALSLRQLIGALAILVSLLFVSCIVFVVEFVYARL